MALWVALVARARVRGRGGRVDRRWARRQPLDPDGACALTAAAMLTYGTAVVRRRIADGLGRWAPLAMGLYPLVVMFPALAATGEPSSVLIASGRPNRPCSARAPSRRARCRDGRSLSALAGGSDTVLASCSGAEALRGRLGHSRRPARRVANDVEQRSRGKCSPPRTTGNRSATGGRRISEGRRIEDPAMHPLLRVSVDWVASTYDQTSSVAPGAQPDLRSAGDLPPSSTSR